MGRREGGEAEEVLSRLREQIAQGRHWYLALLEAMASWPISEEEAEGRSYRYLVEQEAFNWLVLAERLCQAVDGLLPEEEKVAFLFEGRPPLELSPAELRSLLGAPKYRGYLNYFYGVAVEGALLLKVKDDVRKKRRSQGRYDDEGVADEAYSHLYGATQGELLGSFRGGKGLPAGQALSLGEWDEFTYWLFKRRFLSSDRARVASDTREGLAYLYSLRQARGRALPSRGLTTFLKTSSPLLSLSP